jgi:hypothetical protein
MLATNINYKVIKGTVKVDGVPDNGTIKSNGVLDSRSKQ